MFVKRNGAKVAMLIVYVDAIVVIGNDEQEINVLKAYLKKEFEINNRRELKYFLRIEVASPRKEYSFHSIYMPWIYLKNMKTRCQYSYFTKSWVTFCE